ncbi:DUF5672 family protein [Ruegeria arenilitoris]|uniref:DUF5672 family protein n=1 Tax=Ruegeria arenilitoris TaxID=1173585 RepID=UPI00147BA9F4|nr:DUF5672 family protein [Ruegeria arenilitoris]
MILVDLAANTENGQRMMAKLSSSKTCKIVVPVYRRLTEFETAVAAHNLSLLSGFQAVLFGPQSNSQLLKSTAKELQEVTGSNITTECFDDQYFNSVYSYSWLLLHPEFFARFDDVSHILICQTDAIVLSKNLEQWLESEFSYLGAPIFKGFDKPVTPLEFTGMLNGGLSLRKVADAQLALQKIILLKKSWMTSMLKALGLIRAANLVVRTLGKSILIVPRNPHEDVVWTGPISDSLEDFKVPNCRVASQFAFETMSPYLYEKNGEKLPFGCHAFTVYDTEFWRRHLPSWTHAHLEQPRTSKPNTVS